MDTTVLLPAPTGLVDREGSVSAELRPFPYPYRAVLAICSDLDETPNAEAYLELMRFVNTTANTAMGPGAGLEMANSIYFDMPRQQFAYWNTHDAGRAMIRSLVQSGHIDCLHSFGDLATTRAHAGRALEELARHNCRLSVWVDHAKAPSNFGADIMAGYGDVEGSPVYHADLTIGFGIEYVWRGRVTSVVGQNAPPELAAVVRPWRPSSLLTASKEMAKGALGRLRSQKYSMHATNALMRDVRLRSSQPAVEFLRSNPHWAGVNRGETARGLAEVLVPSILDRLVSRQGACILYTHLGKTPSSKEPLPASSRSALTLLARYQREGRILVTTTRRLLDYSRLVAAAAVSCTSDGSGRRIDVRVPENRPTQVDAQGLTVYTPDPLRTRVFVNSKEVTCLPNAGDHTGRSSVSVPWSRLTFPV